MDTEYVLDFYLGLCFFGDVQCLQMAWGSGMRQFQPDAVDIPPFMTVAQAASQIQVKKPTVYGWVRAGALKAAKLPGGKDYRIRRTDFLEFVDTLFGDKKSEPDPEPAVKRTPSRANKDFYSLGRPVQS